MKIIGKLLVNIFVLLMLVGCNAQVIREQDKDSSGRYDGHWTGKVHGTEYYQHSAAYNFYCNPVNLDMSLDIINGIVKAKLYIEDNVIHKKTFINAEGVFRIIEISNNEMSGEDIDMSPTYIQYTIEGRLNEKNINGEFIVGVIKAGGSGCKTDIRFLKENKELSDEMLNKTHVRSKPERKKMRESLNDDPNFILKNPSGTMNVETTIRYLKTLYDKGLLSSEEYNEMKLILLQQAF